MKSLKKLDTTRYLNGDGFEMTTKPPKARFKFAFKLFWRWLKKRHNFLLRLGFCFGLSISVLVFSPSHDFDQRFSIRGPQPTSSEIVIIRLSEKNWLNLKSSDGDQLLPLKDLHSISDNFFWNQPVWTRLLSRLLKLNPSCIGVTLDFTEVPKEFISPIKDDHPFLNEKVIWSSVLSSSGRPIMPIFADPTKQRLALNELAADTDEVIRRIQLVKSEIPHLVESIVEVYYKNLEAHIQQPAPSYWNTKLINFRGQAGQFQSYSFDEVLNGKIPRSAIENKIVLIGSVDNSKHIFRTPLGRMSRAEIIATAIDNSIENRWISESPYWSIVILLLLLTIWLPRLVFLYPQQVSFLVYAWVGLFFSAVSIWAFDIYYLWIPLTPVILLLICLYVSFLSYQLTLSESQTWRLEHEKMALYQLEELKNNFVSLISHDLKTPIAKIQGIVDRLLIDTKNNEIAGDLLALRRESVELHRYIQSILKLSSLESRDMSLNKEATDINELIEAVKIQLAPLAGDKKIQLQLELEPMFLIEVDSVLIQEVILNLVENAIKYTPIGGQVFVKSMEVDDRVIVIVQDSGVGICKADQKKVFEKFQRALSIQDQHIKGTGLGLYLVKFFVELHDGTVFLESEPGQGTTVGFSIPIDLKKEQAGVNNDGFSVKNIDCG